MYLPADSKSSSKSSEKSELSGFRKHYSDRLAKIAQQPLICPYQNGGHNFTVQPWRCHPKVLSTSSLYLPMCHPCLSSHHQTPFRQSSSRRCCGRHIQVKSFFFLIFSGRCYNSIGHVRYFDVLAGLLSVFYKQKIWQSSSVGWRYKNLAKLNG